MRIDEKPKPGGRRKPKPEVEPKRARVVFWDGMRLAPCIETTNENIESRLRECLNDYAKGLPPGEMAAQFVGVTVALGIPAALFNLREFPSTGGTLSWMLRREFWTLDAAGHGEGGVFLVNCNSGLAEYWGGVGLDPESGYNEGVPRSKVLKDIELFEPKEDQ